MRSLTRNLWILVLLLAAGAAAAANSPLTRSQVADFINTRVAVGQLQKDMQAHASQYDDLIHTFYKRRKALLEQRGWTVKEFEAVRDRINAAQNGIETAEDQKADQAEFEADLADIKNNQYMTDEQKQQYIAMQKQSREADRQQYIEPTRRDWPAVKPYLDKLQQLTDWYNENGASAPHAD